MIQEERKMAFKENNTLQNLILENREKLSI